MTALLLTALLLAPVATPTQQEVVGDLYVTSNIAFPSFYIDGAKYEDIVFERKGKLAIIRNLPFANMPTKIVAEPDSEGYEPTQIDTKEADYKLKKRKDGKRYEAKRKVTFAKKKKGKQPAPEKDPEPEEPPPGDDPRDP